MRRSLVLSLIALAALIGTAATSTPSATLAASQRNVAPLQRFGAAGIHKIKHIVVIMQENRSFDQYFGTFPRADGIPGLARHSGRIPCVPDPKHGGCLRPFHDRNDVNFGGPHGAENAFADMSCSNQIDHRGCTMSGFVGQAEHGKFCGTLNPNCSPCKGAKVSCVDVMGYHDAQEIPNYWKYAKDFVLQDHMFEPVQSWSLTEHLYLVSEWAASCRSSSPFSCKTSFGHPKARDGYAWTDLTYLLHSYGISWAYYISPGREPDCVNPTTPTCAAVRQSPATPSLWNPLPAFTDVAADGQLGNIQPQANFFTAAKSGTLPAVSWIVPGQSDSEHPPALVSRGQSYVTGLINAIMRSPDWNSTAIFLSWDDWGGFYDQAVPPAVDQAGYGLRVPGIVISPYAKAGFIDHQVLSHDAYNKFIEDDFLFGQPLNPKTDGRPDPRPDVREALPQLGNLVADFNFSQRPLHPVILPVCPATDLQPAPHC